MTRESNLWRAVADEFVRCAPGVHIQRIENAVDTGTPDVEYCHEGRQGWIELKVAKKPARAATPVRIRHFSKEQRLWHRDRVKSGGRSFILVQVEREYFLFTGTLGAVLLDTLDLESMRDMSLAFGNLKKIVDAVLTNSS